METTQEQWKPIPNMPYEASNHGRIRRASDAANGWKAGYILKAWVVPGGYLRINIMPKPMMAHRLVALAWLGPQPTPEHQINHKNKIRNDNRPENLEWVTCSENHKHRYADGASKPFNGVHTGRKGGKNVPREKIERIVALRGRYSQKKIAMMFGLSQGHVSQIQLRELKRRST